MDLAIALTVASGAGVDAVVPPQCKVSHVRLRSFRRPAGLNEKPYSLPVLVDDVLLSKMGMTGGIGKVDVLA